MLFNRYFQYIGLAIFAGLILCACGKTSQNSTTDAQGFEGYTITPVEGSNISKAVKPGKGQSTEEIGYIANGKKHGMWVKYYPLDKVENISHYVNGKLQGLSVTFDNRGQITQSEYYTDDVLDGLQTTYRFGRPQEEIPYKMGVIEGKVMRYYTNGKIKEGIEYASGKQHGYYRHYNENQQKDLEYLYSHGEKVSGGMVDPAESEDPE